MAAADDVGVGNPVVLEEAPADGEIAHVAVEHGDAGRHVVDEQPQTVGDGQPHGGEMDGAPLPEHHAVRSGVFVRGRAIADDDMMLAR